jgi:hypothetical protein
MLKSEQAVILALPLALYAQFIGILQSFLASSGW